MSTRADVTALLERFSVHYGRPDGAPALVPDEWYRTLGEFEARVLDVALGRVVREYAGQRWRPRLDHVTAACRDLVAEEATARQPRIVSHHDRCRQCGTEHVPREGVREAPDGGTTTKQEGFLCDCQWRARLRYRAGAELEHLRQAGDPDAANELRRRSHPVSSPRKAQPGLTRLTLEPKEPQ